MNDQIAQVLGRIPNLTPEQTDALAKVDLASFADAEGKAESSHGFTATATMSIVHASVEFEVFSVARLAILGILSGDESLVKPWTDSVGAFETDSAAPVVEPVIDTPHAPTEAELADLGASVEAPAVETVVPAAEEVAPALVDAPLDIPEGDIQVPAE